MKLSDTNTLADVLKAHADWWRDYNDGTASWDDERRADLSDAVLSDAVLRGADLRGADLSRAVLSDAVLRGADLRGADLSGADLSGADLRGADLSDAVLSDAVLSGADLPFEVPVVENIDAKILAAVESGGALEMSAWHTCETTHCRAGWAIHFAGGEGRMMEKILGAEVAGTLIYTASRPGKPHPNFFADNETALASIKADAAEAQAANV